MTQNQLKTQIIRKDGKDCLVEVNTQSFSIGKVQFVFAKYNPKNPKGSRMTDRITIFLSFSAALEFAQSILDGRLSKQLVEANNKYKLTNLGIKTFLSLWEEHQILNTELMGKLNQER